MDHTLGDVHQGDLFQAVCEVNLEQVGGGAEVQPVFSLLAWMMGIGSLVRVQQRSWRAGLSSQVAAASSNRMSLYLGVLVCQLVMYLIP